MSQTTAALKMKIAALEARIEERFLELARALRALQESDPAAFAQVVATSAIGRRRAYYLVSVSRAFDGLPVADERLEQIGWTKLAILAPHVGVKNVGELLDLAEGHVGCPLIARDRYQQKQSRNWPVNLRMALNLIIMR